MIEKVTGRRRKVAIAVIAVVGVGLFACLYVAAIAAYHKETNSRTALLDQKPPATPNYMEVQVKVVAVDLVKESMDLRIGFDPNGNLADDEGELTQDMHLLSSSSTGGMDRLLPKDQFISPTDMTIEMTGTTSDYPWDKHEGQLVMILSGPRVDGRLQPVPTRIVFFGSLPGLDLDAAMAKESSPEETVIDIQVQRSTVVKVVVPFSMGLLWVLTATVVAMVVAVMLGNKIEMVMFPFIGTILFSMVAFRNALPGAPPIGAESDYLAFFWGYALSVLALLALTITWLRRLPRKPKPYESGDAVGSGADPVEPVSSVGEVVVEPPERKH
ncbi:MAG: DUF4436 family protein [Candidatus Geothermincolia bacterium]